MTARIRRRTLLKGAVAAATSLAFRSAAGGEPAAWNAGSVAHLLPTVSSDEALLKCSMATPLARPPVLMFGNTRVPGVQTDSQGSFWTFHARGLRPDTTYPLRLLDAGGKALCDPWPLRTFPAPEARPGRVRILAYTCAGGPLESRQYRPYAIRDRLLRRGMAFAPDAVVANGDHVYWDLRTTLEGNNPERRQRATETMQRTGFFDRSEPIIGYRNEEVLKRAAGPQLAGLYGTRFRSTPVFFVCDDHDYFENDEADDRFVTFPPDDLELRAQRATQLLYYPEFLRDARRPLAMPGSAANDRSAGVSECFGTLRYGELLEVLLYDCGRYLSLKGRHGGLVPPEAEAWLLARTRAQDARHLIHVPSTPFAWSAGKWREWYPDLLETDATRASPGDVQMTSDNMGRVRPEDHPRLGTSKRKFMWQEGWFLQQQRILQALSSQARPGLAMSGDLHASGWDRILSCGDQDLRQNAPYMFLHGPVGTGSNGGWPSSARGIAATASTQVRLERGIDPVEKNGFSIIDVTPDRVTVSLFAWREPDPVEAIDSLEPYDVVEVRRDA